MLRWLPALLTTTAMLAAALPGPGDGSAGCRFVLGFAAFAAQLPQVVGQCLDNEQHDPASGNALQHTTSGLLVWRKSDNAIAFTDGSQTWVNGILGIERRSNTQRFIWEANPDNLPLASEVAGGGVRTGAVASYPAAALPVANRAGWSGALVSLQAGTSVALALPAPTRADLGQLPTVSAGGLPSPSVALLPDGDSLLTVTIPATATGHYNLAARWPDGQQGSLRLEVGATTTLMAGLGNPDDLTVAPDGSVLYSDLATNTIGQAQAGSASRTLISGLHVPEGIVVSGADTLLLADQGTDRVYQWTAPGSLRLLWQLAAVRGVEGIDGFGAAVVNGQYTAILPDSANGQLLLLPLSTLTPTIYPGHWQRPTDAVVRVGQLYLVDEYGGRLWRGLLPGSLQPLGPAMVLPDDVVVDADGTAFVNALGHGSTGGSIVRIAADGQSTTILTGLNDPQGIALDGANNLLLTEGGAGRIDADVRSCLPLLLGSASVSLTVGGPVQVLPLGTDCRAGQPGFMLAPGARWPAPSGTTWSAGTAAALTLANGARAALVAGNGAALLLLQPPSTGQGGTATLSVQMRLGERVVQQQVLLTASP